MKWYQQTRPVRCDIMVNLIDSDGKILNVGDVNTGYLTKLLKKKFKDVKTLDLKNDADIKVDLEKKLPIKNESYDYVIAGDIIEHIYHTRVFLKEIHRILKPEGKLILSVPNISSLKNRIKMLFGKLSDHCASGDEFNPECGVHVRDFNLSLIEKLFKRAKFKIIEKKTNGLFITPKIRISSICPVTWGDTIIIKAKKQ